MYRSSVNYDFGEQLTMKFRWFVSAAMTLLFLALWIDFGWKEASLSLAPLVLFLSYNLAIYFFGLNKKKCRNIGYLSFFIDVTALSLHLFLVARFSDPTAVFVLPSIFIFPIIMILSVFYHDKKLIAFTVFYAVFAYNLVFFANYAAIPTAIFEQILASDYVGQIYRSIYLLLFGGMIYQFPNLIYYLLEQKQEEFEIRNKIETELALEKQERLLLNKNVQTQKKLNAELKSKIRELNETNKTKDKLFSIIGHDLKNPFSVMLTLSEILNHDFKELNHEEIKEITTVIHSSATQGNKLLENLLKWAKSQSGQTDVFHEKLAIDFIINEIVNGSQSMAGNKKIQLQNNVTVRNYIYADNNLTHTIFRNILSNAIKFTPEGGTIQLSATAEEKYINISVADSGVGIPDEKIPKLFKLEKNFSTRGTNNEEGTGLGLVLVKEFVDKNNGRIQVKSEIGKGTVFTISLPAYT